MRLVVAVDVEAAPRCGTLLKRERERKRADVIARRPNVEHTARRDRADIGDSRLRNVIDTVAVAGVSRAQPLAGICVEVAGLYAVGHCAFKLVLKAPIELNAATIESIVVWSAAAS